MPEQILQTLSTLGRISLQEFNSAFGAIQNRRLKDRERDLHETRRRAIRFLDALGHCEFDFDRRQVYACPPFLVTLPVSGLHNAVLTGARTPLMIQMIKEYVIKNKNLVLYKSLDQITDRHLLPAAVFIEAIDRNTLTGVAEAAQINCKLDIPACWALVNFSLGIEDVVRGLSFESRADLNWYKETFSVMNLRFLKYNNKLPGELIAYTNPTDQQRYHLIWEDKRASEVDRDWGRYIILAKHGERILLYDQRRHLLAVPSSVPLPRILARAAALCSGLAPETIPLGDDPIGGLPSGCDVDIYSSVPIAIARLISLKLSQDIIPYNIVTGDTCVMK